MSCYYFYLWDIDFGPAFVKVCTCFPYPAKVWLNGHEWAKCQAERAGIGFTELSNGFAATDDPVVPQAICDRLGPGVINVFRQRWFSRLPLPFTNESGCRLLVGDLDATDRDLPHDRVDAPRHARGFFEALIVDNLDLGRPHNVEIIFNRRIRRDTQGTFRTAIDRRDNGGVLVNVFYKHSSIKQYLKDGRAMRIETVINAPRDLGGNARLPNRRTLSRRRLVPATSGSCMLNVKDR